jgi:hypothetical protein
MAMGFEHQVYLNLTSTQRSELHKLLTIHPFFSRSGNQDGKLLYEFSGNKSKPGTPDFLVVIEEEGLYVCHNKSSQPWAGMEFIEQYLLENNIPYRIHEL